LLVEDDLEDELLLSEALIEIEENRQWCNWRTAGVMHVEVLRDALACLQDHHFDVVLLNLTLPDSPVVLDTFRQANACARGSPIVVLADEADENLAHLLLREGAQDVLLKSELEGASLARSLRYSIERQHRVGMVERAEALKGPCFLCLGKHYLQLSRLTRVPLLLATLEISEPINQTPHHREARDLLLLRAGEALDNAFASPSVIGRLGHSRFGLLTAGLTKTTVEALLNRAAITIESAARTDGLPSATVHYSIAPIDPDADLEELLGQDGNEFPASKTAMLTD
jgi:CheY-like chemotaxis protein/GGDEF domain-containing protein